MRELKNKLETEMREDKRAVLQEKVSRNVTKLTAACRERENVSVGSKMSVAAIGGVAAMSRVQQ